MQNRIKSQSQLNLFLIVSGGITLAFLIANFITCGDTLNSATLSASYLFGDYFSHLGYSSLGPTMYSLTEDACLPPLAYCAYYILWRMAPSVMNADVLFWEDGLRGDNTQLIFIMFNLVMILLLQWVILHYFNAHGGKYILALSTIILFSYPCMFTSIQRGNSALFVAILLCIIWLWIDETDKRKREAALILIAIAAGFKIYPALLGIVLVKRKDWKAVVRLLIYGAVFFFVPFIFFGGIEGLKNFFSTMFSIAGWSGVDHYGTVRGMSIYVLREHTALSADAAEKAGYVIETLFLVFTLSVFFLARKKWQEVILTSAILVSYIGSNAHYTIVYYLPALMMFLQENESTPVFSVKKLGISLITLSLAIIFSCPFFWPKGMYMGASVAGYFMWAVTVWMTIFHTRRE